METERQKSRCIRGSTGTTYKILIVLASLYFLTNYYVMGLVSVISMGLLGRKVKAFLLLALATLAQVAVDLLFPTNTAIRLLAVLLLLITGSAIVYIVNNRMLIASIALATSSVTLGLIAVLFILLDVGSISASCGLTYLYSLFLVRALGVLLVVSGSFTI